MSTKAVEGQVEVRRYEIQYPVLAYTFPREAKIHHVGFDDEHVYVELIDGHGPSSHDPC